MNNIMRKLSPLPRRRGEGETEASGLDQAVVDATTSVAAGTMSPVGATQDRTLTLMHLRKMFSEYCKVPLGGSKDNEQKMARMLPLFAKVMKMYSAEELATQFKELAAFTGHLSRLFVQEIRLRASNQSTEEAAVAIADFLQPQLREDGSETSDDPDDATFSRGWLLLTGLIYLVNTNHLAAIEAACKAALPSTLAKALYLFFDLPPIAADNEQLAKRRQALHTHFVDLLLRLCSHSCAGEELARKDDLSLLFNGASSWCPNHNLAWRKATAELVMVITARILSQTVIKYCHSKGCISQFLQNLKAGDQARLSVAERADMIVCLCCILKDSSNVTAVLLNDFKEADGYNFLVNFVLENEHDDSAETQDALRNLLLMFNSAVTAGFTELKPSLTGSLYSLPGFVLPSVLGHGISVRNVDAFRVLEEVFIKSQRTSLCSTVLDVINSIYSADPANYFILDKECALGQFAEHIYTKEKSVQLKFFELLEYVVFHLNHIPCKEFIALCVVLKTQALTNTESCILCVQSCFRILSFNLVLRDAFREVGLLEVLTSMTMQFSERIRAAEAIDLSQQEKTLALLAIDMLTMLMKGNAANARVFRECGGSKCAQDLIPSDAAVEWRPSLLQLMQQLLMLPGGDEDLSALLVILHTSPPEQLALKTVVLKSLLCVLRESHKVRLVFRRVGGYLCIMSLLLNLEGALNDDPKAPWDQVKAADPASYALIVLDFLHLLFKVLTISMRFEPANAKQFFSEVRYDSLTVSLKLTGAFEDIETIEAKADTRQVTLESCRDWLTACHRVFQVHLDDRVIPTDIPHRMLYVCYILRLLFNMALDNYEKPSGDLSKCSASEEISPLINGNHNRTLFPNAPDSIIVHPGAVMCILDLLPAIVVSGNDDPVWALVVQLYAAEVLKSLVRSERNQQVMCDAGLPRRLFVVGNSLLKTDVHLLLPPFYYILERLSNNSMQPRELRYFLRLDKPLCCRNLEERPGEEPMVENEGGPVPLTRVKALVSMMTPRDYRVGAAPPFIEFDMSVEGFGCVFLPSISPVLGSAANALANSDGIGGGVGSGERIFPPLTGLSFSAWIYVERFSDKRKDSHPLRLLTVTRTMPQCSAPEKLNRRSSTLSEWFGGDQSSGSFNRQSSDGAVSPGDQVELSCLTIQLSPIDRALLIATFESDTPGADLDHDSGPADSFMRIAVADLMEEKQWHHIVVVLNRAVLKQSTVSVYVDGRHQSTQKLHYVIAVPGGGATTLAQATGVHATIGTPPGPLRKQSCLLWRLGTAFLLEEALNADAVKLMYRLGAQYSSSYQTPSFGTSTTVSPPLLSEERLAFGVSALAVSQMTISKLRRIYSKVDCRIVAKHLGISTNENATPIRILHNTAGNLAGPARTLGGVLIGYLGMRTFCPCPVARLLESVGGISSLFGLVAMANDSEGLYASLKALLCAIRNNDAIALQIQASRGYQTLAMLLEEKCHLLNSHILHLVFALTGTLDSARETTVIPNQQAFEDLLCDLDVWKNAPEDLQRLLYEHFYELITESGEHKENLKVVRQTGLLSRLLFRLSDNPKLLLSTKDVVFNLLAAILQPLPDTHSLLRYGQFIASTLATPGVDSGYEASLPFEVKDLQTQLTSGELIDPNLYNVYVRNRCLNILANSLVHTSGVLNSQLCEQFVRVLGFDWLLALMSPHCHPGTVFLALRLLLALLSNPSLLQKFREGNGNGGWLTEAESVVQNRAGVLLGFSVSAHGGAVGSQIDINPELSHCPGFVALQHVLSSHSSHADCYLAMLSLLVGQPTKDLHHLDRFDLDSVWSVVFGLPASSSVADAIAKAQLCSEAVSPLLAMVRRCLQQEAPSNSGDSHWSVRFPRTVLQFLTFLYHNSADFSAYCASEQFAVDLMSTLFRDCNDMEAPVNENFVVIRDDLNEEPTDHPSRKSIVEFLKSILVDSFHTSFPGKGEALIDVLLETTPDTASKKEQNQFVTELLKATMDHLLAGDVLLCGMSASLPLTSNTTGASYATLATNVFYFASRLVDCVWNGQYTEDAANVMEFLIKLHSQAKRKSGIPLDALMHSINRIVLFLLSRSAQSVQLQATMMDSLNKVISNRAVIFCPANTDSEFFGCLAHLLFMLSVKPDCQASNDMEERQFENGSTQLAVAARRVWEELYMAKKATLEEKFKTVLVPEVNAARSLVGEVASAQWQMFVDGEIRGPSRDLTQIHQQLQSKIQKVASGLQRLTSRKAIVSATGSNAITRQTSTISPQILNMWIRVHSSLIRELVRLQSTRYHQWHSHVQKWCLDEWHSVEQELTRERGLWGPDLGSSLDKWRLDTTETPSRIRRKLVPNQNFYALYPYRPYLDLPESKSMRAKVAISRDSRIFYEKMKERRPRTIDPRIFDQSTMINTPSEEKVFLFRDMQEINASMIRRASLKPPVKKDSPVEEDEDVEDEERMVDIDGTSIERSGSEKSRRSAASTGVQSPSAVSPPPVTNAEEQAEAEDKFEVAGKEVAKLPPQAPIPKGPDNQTLLRLLEEGEELHSMFRCARIQGLDTCEGLLLFGKEHYYVVDGFTLLKTREIRDLDFLPEDLHDPIVPYTATGSVRPSSSKRTCSKFSYDDIREVHKRRYLLQPIALEVFSADGRNYLLAFPKKMRNRVHTKFLSVAKDLTDGGAQSVSGQRSSMSVEQSGRASSLFSSLIGESSVTQRWVRGEISNFQYLMFLNTLAGRTFNDLSQYPIFPWILRDYDSEVLDLTDPNAFRDLSKPMGAQTPDRLEQFLKRYREWDDPTGETPPYMYGTHYSSAMIIVSYLVRLEPFTQQFLKLQGGHFDLADRMFHSVGDAWMSASKNNMADVKELIPEFFYLPEMFANANNFDLGVKQNGIALDDVILPPWAKGDPREFIRVHREALESDYVSAHLHDWIDLIFGAKQQGQGAIDGQNLYHHLFYEGNVDFEAIEDPLTRNATIGFINNFGQIPTQLFRKPHPQKKLSPASSLSRAAVGLTTSPDSWTSTPGVTTERLFFHAIDCLKPPAQPVKELKGGVGQILQNEKGQLCAVEQNKVLLPPNFTRYLSWGFADRSIRLGNYETDKSSCVHELTDCGEIVCGVCPNSRTLITGSTNTVVNVWELCGATGRSNGPSRLRLRKALYGHTESVTCLASSSSYGLVVSGSRDATCIVWDLSGLSLIRQLRPHSGPVSAVVINEATGDMASASGTNLFVWSINGQLLSMVNTATTSAIDNRQLILTIGFSTLNEWDSQHVIFTGSNDGVVRLWSLEFVQVATAETQPAADASNAPLSDVDKDQATSSCHAAVSTNSKGLRQFCPEILQERLTRQKRKLIASCGSSLDTPSGETPRNWSLSGSPEPSSPFLQDADSGFATPICNRSLSFGSANAMPGGAMQRQYSTDSLVNVSARTCPRLKPGFHWQRQLVYRFKLTMHTAFDRKDNAAPAPISAVAASRDHKTLFVGDSRGRVWPWVLGDVSSGRADHWVQDPSKNNCTQCHQRFTLAERKHHCRNCGQIFCARCSRFESEIKHMKITKPVRVCQSCFLRLKAETM